MAVKYVFQWYAPELIYLFLYILMIYGCTHTRQTANQNI